MTGTPDLLYSDVEDDLRAAVRDVLADRCPHAAVLARCESGTPYDPDLWRTLAVELGLAGLLVPEELGGQGASAREVAVVLEELGGAVAPVPFLGSAVLATTALLGCEAPGSLKRIASGEAVAALVVPLATGPGAGFPTAVRADADGVLHGGVTSVADAVTADVLVVAAVGPEGPGIYEVAADAAGVRIEPVTSLDLTRPVADVTLTGAAARRLAGPATAAAALENALLTGAGLLASEQFGVASRCLDLTVRLPRRTAAVRPRRRILPGRQAPPRRRVARRGLVPCGGPCRGGRPGQRRGRRRDRGQRGPVVLCGRRRAGRGGVRPAARRHRHDVGAPGPPLPQACQGRTALAGQFRPAPGTARRAGGPAGGAVVLRFTPPGGRR